MKTMTWLLRREIWEHKGSLFWAPIIVAAIMLLVFGVPMAYGLATHELGSVTLANGHRLPTGAALNSLSYETRADIVRIVAASYMAASAPLFAMLAVIAFFYCLGALHDERRDRSILFWKSLPISDQMTVLSKVITAACVAPLITLAAATLMSVLLLLICCIVLALHGVQVFGLLLSSPDLYLAPVRLLGLLPVYVLWALPTIGWLLMVSAWARSKVFLWAVGTPLLALVIGRWLGFLSGSYMEAGPNVGWFAHHVVGRGLGGLFPGIWLAFDNVTAAAPPGRHGLDLGTVFEQSWMTVAGPGVWLGAVAGVAMIFAAMRLRRWREEG